MTKTTAFLFAMAVSAAAQDDLDRRIDRMKEQLKLTDEQVAKLREIYRDADRDRDEKVLGVLNDEQKKLFEESRRGGDRGERGGGRGFRGLMGGFGIDQIKEALGLDDEQTQKIQGILDQFREDAQKKMEELREKGFQGFNWQEEIQKALTDLGNKIKEHLTPDQKEKFDKLVEERMRGFRPPGGGGERRPQRPSVEERTQRVMEALQVADEQEKSAIQELVSKVYRARDEAEEDDRTYREKARELARSDLGDEALEEKLKELREERKKREKALSTLQKELSEIVTFRQEAALVEHGVLR